MISSTPFLPKRRLLSHTRLGQTRGEQPVSHATRRQWLASPLYEINGRRAEAGEGIIGEDQVALPTHDLRVVKHKVSTD